jgi:hypothetical protein
LYGSEHEIFDTLPTAQSHVTEILPMWRGQAERRTPDYFRTYHLALAALDVKTGKVVGQCHQAASKRGISQVPRLYRPGGAARWTFI